MGNEIMEIINEDNYFTKKKYIKSKRKGRDRFATEGKEGKRNFDSWLHLELQTIFSLVSLLLSDLWL